MSVGFVLPAGQHSRANTKQLVVPFPIIDVNSPNPFDFNPQSEEFAAAMRQRYGETKKDADGNYIFLFADCPGLHATIYKGALETIAELDPGYFARMGWGSATGGNVADDLEFHDVQYWQENHQTILNHANELSGGGDPGPCPPVPPLPEDAWATLEEARSWFNPNFRPKQHQRYNAAMDEMETWVNKVGDLDR